MYLLKILKTIILLCLITYVACQDDQCDPTVDEDQLEYFENDPETKAPDEIEMEKAMEELTDEKQKELKDDFSITKALESREDDGITDKLQAPVVAWPQPLCDSKFKSVRIGRTLWYNGGRCYVLRPWWNRVFTAITYATCKKQRCRNLPCQTWLCLYRWYCYPANYKIFNIWLWCPHTRPSYKRLPIRLAQCCECRRRWVKFDFPEDFTAANSKSRSQDDN